MSKQNLFYQPWSSVFNLSLIRKYASWKSKGASSCVGISQRLFVFLFLFVTFRNNQGTNVDDLIKAQLRLTGKVTTASPFLACRCSTLQLKTSFMNRKHCSSWFILWLKQQEDWNNITWASLYIHTWKLAFWFIQWIKHGVQEGGIA